MKILRTSDRVKIKMGDVAVTISPISYSQRVEISSHSKVENGVVINDLQKQTMLLLKYSIKAVEGLEDYSGEQYVLKLENDQLTDECASELANCFLTTKMAPAISYANAGNFAKELEGVEFEVVPN